MSVLHDFEVESDVVAQLRALAGAGPEVSEFEFSQPSGPRIRVTYREGSGSHIEFTARCGWTAGAVPTPGDVGYRAGVRGVLRAKRPMQIELRVEDALDRMAKVEGVAREFQTGDPLFDDAVYVNTDTDDAVLRAVLTAEVRGAVLSLRAEGLRVVTIDDAEGRVQASLYSFAHPGHDAHRASRILAAFEALARAIPEVEPDSARPASSGLDRALNVVVALATVLFWGGLPAYFVFILPTECREATDGGWSGPCGPAWQGLVFGVLLGVLPAVWVHRRIRGTSNAHRLRGGAAFVLWFCTLLATLLGTGIVKWHL